MRREGGSIAQASEPDPAAATFVPLRPAHRAACVVVALLYLLLAFQRSMQAGSTVSDGLLLALAFNVLLRLAPFLWIRRGVGWFHPVIFSAVLGFVDLLRGFDAFSMGLSSHIAVSGGSDQLNALLLRQTNLISMGLAAYYVGYFAGPRIPLLGLRIVLGGLPALTRRAVGIAVIATVSWVLYMGGPSGIVSHLALVASGGSRTALAGSYYLLLPVELALCAWWVWFGHVDKVTPRVALAGVALTGANYVTFGGRSIFIYSGLVTLVIWGMRRGVFPAGRVVALAVVGTYAIATLGNLGVDRGTGRLTLASDESHSVLRTVGAGFSGEISERATSRSGALAILAHVPESTGYLNGSSYVAALTVPVPRALWPGKPGLIDGRVGRTFFRTNGGVPASAPGEAYWNFGVPGVAAVFALFGVFHRWLARMILFRRHERGAVVLYAVVLVFFRSPESSAFLNAVEWLALVCIVLMIAGMVRFRRSSAVPVAGPPAASGSLVATGTG